MISILLQVGLFKVLGVRNIVIITKHKESFLNVKYFFIKGKLENLNSNYFIQRIEKGLREKNNLSYQTNVKGSMTSYNFFNNDPEFRVLMNQFCDYIDNNKVNDRDYVLRDSWGLRESCGDYTCMHNHRRCSWSGIIYLSNVDQPLYFPDINEKLDVEIGSFAIFSSWLNHGTKNRTYKNQHKLGIAFNYEELQ